MSDIYKKQIIDEITRIEDRLKEDFGNLLDDSISKIPEIIFVRDFLPMFSGEIPNNDYLISMWYTISGGPFNQVKVVDNSGKTVAIVPPVLDRDLVRSDRPANTSLIEIFNDHEGLSHISPIAANNRLHDDLVNGYCEDIKGSSNIELTNKWIALLNQYSKSDTSTKSKPKVVLDQDIEYD